MSARRDDPSRRLVLGGAVAFAAVGGRRRARAAAETGFALTLKQGPDGVPSFDSALSDPSFRFRQGQRLKVTVTNAVTVPVALSIYGFDGLSATEPLLAQPPLAPASSVAFDLPLTEAGTFGLDARLLGDGAPWPLPMAALAVTEAEPPVLDQDHVLLFEDRRLREDGGLANPGLQSEPPRGYTVNGQSAAKITVSPLERLRLRLINGCHRNAIALQFSDHAVTAVAFDSQPAEPFPLRDGRLVLAPAARIDVLLDATGRPGATYPVLLFDGTGPKPILQLSYADLPPVRARPLSTEGFGRPAAAVRPDLANAFRTTIELHDREAKEQNSWISPNALAAARPEPAFRVKRGRTVTIALKNTATRPIAFRLHGHHFRWLDRLDDGWKPFLLDTLLLDTGQTERIAFTAQHPGAWLIEATALAWSAPKRLRWFAVD